MHATTSMKKIRISLTCPFLCALKQSNSEFTKVASISFYAMKCASFCQFQTLRGIAYLRLNEGFATPVAACKKSLVEDVPLNQLLVNSSADFYRWSASFRRQAFGCARSPGSFVCRPIEEKSLCVFLARIFRLVAAQLARVKIVRILIAIAEYWNRMPSVR